MIDSIFWLAYTLDMFPNEFLITASMLLVLDLLQLSWVYGFHESSVYKACLHTVPLPGCNVVRIFTMLIRFRSFLLYYSPAFAHVKMRVLNFKDDLF